MYPAGSPSPARYANARCRSRRLARLSWLTPRIACSTARTSALHHQGLTSSWGRMQSGTLCLAERFVCATVLGPP